jgi:hypothetical protein
MTTHLSFANLVDLAENQMTAEEKSTATNHLLSCSLCATELDRVEQTIKLMKTDKTVDAPPELLKEAIAVFRRRKGSASSALRRIVAALSFDSLTLTPAFGVRSAPASSRQLLYTAEETDIDLRITGHDDKWVVSGQVLGQDCSGGLVEIEAEQGSAAATLNDECEFTLPAVSGASCSIRLRLNNLTVEIPQLELKA